MFVNFTEARAKLIEVRWTEGSEEPNYAVARDTLEGEG